MKKIFYISFILFAVSFLYAQNEGDFYFNKKNEILDKNKAIGSPTHMVYTLHILLINYFPR